MVLVWLYNKLFRWTMWSVSGRNRSVTAAVDSTTYVLYYSQTTKHQLFSTKSKQNLLTFMFKEINKRKLPMTVWSDYVWNRAIECQQGHEFVIVIAPTNGVYNLSFTGRSNSEKTLYIYISEWIIITPLEWVIQLQVITACHSLRVATLKLNKGEESLFS